MITIWCFFVTTKVLTKMGVFNSGNKNGELIGGTITQLIWYTEIYRALNNNHHHIIEYFKGTVRLLEQKNNYNIYNSMATIEFYFYLTSG